MVIVASLAPIWGTEGQPAPLLPALVAIEFILDLFEGITINKRIEIDTLALILLLFSYISRWWPTQKTRLLSCIGVIVVIHLHT